MPPESRAGFARTFDALLFVVERRLPLADTLVRWALAGFHARDARFAAFSLVLLVMWRTFYDTFPVARCFDSNWVHPRRLASICRMLGLG